MNASNRKQSSNSRKDKIILQFWRWDCGQCSIRPSDNQFPLALGADRATHIHYETREAVNVTVLDKL